MKTVVTIRWIASDTLPAQDDEEEITTSFIAVEVFYPKENPYTYYKYFGLEEWDGGSTLWDTANGECIGGTAAPIANPRVWCEKVLRSIYEVEILDGERMGGG